MSETGEPGGTRRGVFDLVAFFDFMGSLPCHPSRVRLVTEELACPPGSCTIRIEVASMEQWPISTGWLTVTVLLEPYSRRVGGSPPCSDLEKVLMD